MNIILTDDSDGNDCDDGDCDDGDDCDDDGDGDDYCGDDDGVSSLLAPYYIEKKLTVSPPCYTIANRPRGFPQNPAWLFLKA